MNELIALHPSCYQALCCGYDIIFEIDLSAGTVSCIYGRETSPIGSLYDARMTIDSAKLFWLNNFIPEEDRERMARYFDAVTAADVSDGSAFAPQEFHLRWSSGTLYTMQGVAAETGPDVRLFCCRCLARETPAPVTEPPAGGKNVFARTFGHFDLFLNGEAVVFSGSKEKELLALLVDRNGGTVSSAEAISCLWEDAPPDERIRAKYRKLALGLKLTLEKYGLGDLVINRHGVRSINRSALRCDYFDLLAGDPKAAKDFHNQYMSEYSWSEPTLAALWDYS